MNSDILYIPHGGGPLPLLGEPGHRDLTHHLTELGKALPRPSAILVVSAHWEAQRPTVTSAAAPELLYDYYGFPPEAYTLAYPCPGEPALAQQVEEVLNAAGLPAARDRERGLDHGAFVPLSLMYPDAGIPCVQLSLADSLDPALHLAIGHALRALDYPGLLVLGSGFSFHNMQAFQQGHWQAMERACADFERWLHSTCADPGLSWHRCERQLAHWKEAPSARYCHPREEHLLPLHVCAGIAGRACDYWASTRVIGATGATLYWAASPAHSELLRLP